MSRISLIAFVFFVCIKSVLIAQTSRNPNNDGKKRAAMARNIRMGNQLFLLNNAQGTRSSVNFADVVQLSRNLSEAPGDLSARVVSTAEATLPDVSSVNTFSTHLQMALEAISHDEFTSVDSAAFESLASDLNNSPECLDALSSNLMRIQPDSINFSLIGIAGSSSVQELKQSSASVSVGLRVAFGKHYNRNTGYYHLYQRNIFTMMFNPGSAVSNDSASVAKTLLFPEISKRDFQIGYERIFPFAQKSRLYYTNNDYRPTTWSYFAEFSTSHFDTGISAFRSYNGTMGFKLNIQGEEAGLGFALQIAPYYSVIGVEHKDWNSMDLALLGKSASYFDTLPKKGVPPTIHTLGVNFKLSISTFEIFANFKYILNDERLSKNDYITNNDLKNTVMTIGVLISPDIWHFNRPIGPQNLTRQERVRRISQN